MLYNSKGGGAGSGLFFIIPQAVDGLQYRRRWSRLYLGQFPEIMKKRKRGRGMQSKAEDAGGLTPAKDGNAAMPFPDR